MNRTEIERVLPHRDPFLFVDEITDRGEGWLAARWTVPVDADWFRGHYPGNPLLPGVLITEHTLQCGALLAAEREAQRVGALDGNAGAAAGVPVLTRLSDARFKRMVRPGETLETRVTLEDVVSNAYYMKAEVRCAGARVLTVKFTVAAVEAPTPQP